MSVGWRGQIPGGLLAEESAVHGLHGAIVMEVFGLKLFNLFTGGLNGIGKDIPSDPFGTWWRR